MTVVDILKKKGKDVLGLLYGQNRWFSFVTIYLAIVILVIFGVYGAKYDASQFIYFQF